MFVAAKTFFVRNLEISPHLHSNYPNYDGIPTHTNAQDRVLPPERTSPSALPRSAPAVRRGYTAGAAWDEGAMIQAMARMDNPTLRWRYGDDVEERGDTETQPETGDG